MRLIVYGTLMRGESNHHMMRLCGMDGAEYLGDVIVPNAMLYNLGGYPGLMFMPVNHLYYDDYKVYGELYEVAPNHIKHLDAFEGVPTLYDRVKCVCINEFGDHIEAYVYEYQDPYDTVQGEYLIKSGNWKDR